MASSSCSPFPLLPLFILITSCSQSTAREFIIGGKNSAWKVPSESLNQWANATRFQIGDSLVWQSNDETESVLEVTREEYMSCNTAAPLKRHKGRNAMVMLARSGAYYFISGDKAACEKGAKVIVVVLSERHSLREMAPAPSSVVYDGPAVAPTSGALGTAVAVRRGAVGGGLVVLVSVVGMLL